jgi:hypothetical protein
LDDDAPNAPVRILSKDYLDHYLSGSHYHDVLSLRPLGNGRPCFQQSAYGEARARADPQKDVLEHRHPNKLRGCGSAPY